jgi:hypothetical protein
MGSIQSPDVSKTAATVGALQATTAPNAMNQQGGREQQWTVNQQIKALAVSATAGVMPRFAVRPSINLRGMPPRLVQKIALMAAQVCAKHGEDPATLAQAAAHEAGHVIVAFALGGTPRRVRIFRESYHGREVWLGTNSIRWRWAADAYPFAFESDIPRAFTEMVVTISGFMGEESAGLGHPSSSLDERAIVTMGARGIAPLLGCEVVDAEVLFGATAMLAIRESRTAFDELRALLQLRRHLESFEIQRVLHSHGAKRMDLGFLPFSKEAL